MGALCQIGIGTRIEQIGADFRIIVLSRPHERRPSFIIRSIRISPIIQQRLHLCIISLISSIIQILRGDRRGLDRFRKANYQLRKRDAQQNRTRNGSNRNQDDNQCKI
ncbi:hypothetical protein D3C78_921850 [compost metagenome]